MQKPVPNTQTGSLTDHQHGTDDTLIGLANALNTLYGDAFAMDDHASGGNDTLIGGVNATNVFYGDARAMNEPAAGGDDTLIGGAGIALPAGDPSIVLYGDAFDMH